MKKAQTQHSKSPARYGFAICIRRREFIGTLSLLALSQAANAQVYAGFKADGTLVLSSLPEAAATELIVSPLSETSGEPRDPLQTPKIAIDLSIRAQAPLGHRLAGDPPPHVLPLIVATAREYRLPAALIAAVVAVESGFDARAVSPKGAMGLMQLMPATARRFNVKNPFVIEDNLRGGTAYLRWLCDRFELRLDLVLAAYNAGEGAVERTRTIPDFAETRAYVPKVIRIYKQYAQTTWASDA